MSTLAQAIPYFLEPGVLVHAPATLAMHGPVAVVTVDHGKVNALDHEAIDSLLQALDHADQHAQVVVLAGRPNFFCAGLDMNVMHSGSEAMSDLFEREVALALRLVRFPRPVVAACTGHALGAGAALLLCCDVRIGAAGDFQIGFNEVAIGVPLYDLHFELARSRLAPQYVALACNTAQIYTPDQATRVGFLDSTTSENAIEQASRVAAGLAQRLDADAFAATRTTTNVELTRVITRLTDDLHRLKHSIASFEQSVARRRSDS